jgi:hypothetical protein
MALSSESQLDNNSHKSKMGKNGTTRQFFSYYKKSAEIITQKPYGFNDKVATKKSNAKTYINDKL